MISDNAVLKFCLTVVVNVYMTGFVVVRIAALVYKYVPTV